MFLTINFSNLIFPYDPESNDIILSKLCDEMVASEIVQFIILN